MKGGSAVMEIHSLKLQARELLGSRKKQFLIPSLIYVLLALLFSYLSLRLTMPPAEQLLSLSDRMTALLQSGDVDGATKLAAQIQPSTAEPIVSDLLSYLLAIVSFGLLMIYFHVLRGEETETGMLLDGFSNWAKVLLLVLITRLLTTLGFWAFLIPGFVLLYNYRMARYLMILHPDFGVLDCMRESRMRMRGHRLELLRLDLSFLGWALLSVIPFLGIAIGVWALPYWSLTSLLAYEKINAGFEPSSPEKRDTDLFL